MRTTKYSLSEIRHFFFLQGYTLLTEEYTNSHQYMEYQCPNGHRGSIRWYHFQAGGRCAKCRGNARIAHQEAAEYFESKGCQLLEEFTSSQVPLRYKCSCGRIGRIRWYDFKRGKRCRRCMGQRYSGPNSPRWNPDRAAVALTRKLANAAHTALKTTLKYLGKKKNARTYQVLGYTGEELRKAIESHPSWESLKGGDWSLDHVFPIKAFVDFGICDLRLINSLDNLQPMILSENQSKSKSYSKEEFSQWLGRHGYAV